MIRITRLTNKYGKCGSYIDFEESNDAALYLWGKEVCNFLISKDGHKFETASTNTEDIERELDNFVDGWDVVPRKNHGSLNKFSFTNVYESKIIAFLAEYYTYTKKDVAIVYAKCGKSFDKTERALHLGSAYNNIELGILEANK